MKRLITLAALAILTTTSYAAEDFFETGGSSTFNSFKDTCDGLSFQRLIKEAKANAFLKAENRCTKDARRISNWYTETGTIGGHGSYIPCYDFAKVEAAFICE